MVVELCEHDFLPSFCTSCYRVGRVGTKFMEHAKSGHIHQFCQPNALSTFQEYIEDYGSEKVRAVGEKLIAKHLGEMQNDGLKTLAQKQIQQIIAGKRDLHV